MRYPHLLAALRSAKWCATEPTIQAIRDVLAARMSGHSASLATAHRADDLEEGDGSPSADCPPFEVIAPGVACVEVRGIIGKHLSGMEIMCGGCDLEEVEANLLQAITTPGIAAIILHLDTPGGVVTGVPELAAKIRLWGQVKPIYAFTDTLCASAGYWLASACRGILCTPTADLGSIGVYMAAVDDSEEWAKEGKKLVLVKSGARKAEGINGLPIEAATIAAWQSKVDSIYAMFTADVLACRPGVSPDSMQGQCFMGASAVMAQLADQVIADRDVLAQSLAIALPQVALPTSC